MFCGFDAALAMKKIFEFISKAVRYTLGRLILIGLVAESSAIAKDSHEPSATASITIRTSGAWKLVESPNFRCWCQMADDQARQLATSCEAWRDRLRATWMCESVRERWLPKCEILVFPDRTQYNCALNRPGDLSVGCTRMKFDQGRTVFRRIDLRADVGDWLNAALPHELTHVVLGERFGGRSLPRWADEGIAMLSESSEKHQERLVNLREVLKRGTSITVQDLVQAQCITEPDKRDAYYGQSVALTSLLISKSTPARFADFIDDSRQMGFDHALRKHYQLNGIDALQREWDDWMKHPKEVSINSLSFQIRSNATVTAIKP